MLSSWNKGIAPHEFGLNTGRDGSRHLPHRARPPAVPRRRNGVDEAFLRRHVRDGIGRADRRAAARARSTIPHRGSDQQLRAADVRSARTASPNRAGRFRRRRSSATTTSASRTPTKHYARRAAASRSRSSGCRRCARACRARRARSCDRRDATLDLHVGYISGGGASGLPVKAAHGGRAVAAAVTRLRGLSVRRRTGARRRADRRKAHGWDLDFEGEAHRLAAAKAQVLRSRSMRRAPRASPCRICPR